MTTGKPRTLVSLCVLAALLVVSLAIPSLAAAAAKTTFTIDGGGWGHGIGMSQYGAQGFALKGWSYTAILTHFYQDTEIRTVDVASLPKVQVNIDKSAGARSSWWITSSTDASLVVTQYPEKNATIALSGTKSYWITAKDGKTRIHTNDDSAPGTVLKTFDGECYVASDGLVRMKSASGPFGYHNIDWRGTIHFVPVSATTTKARNWVDIESYLLGVVPRESPSSFDAEALKAQSVAARSYVYDDAKNKRAIYCTTMSQVYNGASRPGYDHEPDSTTSAVKATKGRVVWYPGETKPVKTFFFSSSGGRTASIEDVWTSSTPRPYYDSVTDADQASPHYRWSVGPLSNTDVSPKIRSKVGTTLSAPSPYQVVGISLVQSHGYARYADVEWSNGKTYRIKGDQLRSALALKSTHFGIKWRREESSSLVVQDGAWKTSAYSGSSGGTHIMSRRKGKSVTTVFTGAKVSVIGGKYSSYGKSAVYIDGEKVGTIDQYGATRKNRQVLFSKSGLGTGEHTVTVKVLGTKNTAATSTWVAIDAFDVVGGSAP